MTDRKDSDFKKVMALHLFLVVFFGVMLLIGTFYDEAVTKVLHNPDSLAVKLVSAIGPYPFSAFFVIYEGCLLERARRSKLNKNAKNILCAFVVLLIVLSGIIASAILVDKDSLGYIYPQLRRNIPVILVISLITVYPLANLGYRMAKNTEDDILHKRIICLLITMVGTFVLLEVLKDTFHRPRYRVTLLGYEGIGFIPWYKPFAGFQEYIDNFGIDKGEFRSFPSGHSIFSTSMIIILESLAFVSVKLKDKRVLLGIIGLIFACIIMLTRIILGAHYLSDVSAGAFIASVIALIFTCIQEWIR